MKNFDFGGNPKIIDISQELLSCRVFPGDPSPSGEKLMRISEGAVCNLTKLSMCAHNGTHTDAPYHFIDEGKTIEELPIETFVGVCYVARHSGQITGADAVKLLEKATACGAGERILIGGKATVTAAAAKVFAEAGIKLIGNESQTVGPEDAPMEVHLILLGAGIALLEGVILEGVEEGKYFLCSAPLKISGADGAPCRAYLIETERGNKYDA